MNDEKGAGYSLMGVHVLGTPQGVDGERKKCNGVASYGDDTAAQR